MAGRIRSSLSNTVGKIPSRLIRRDESHAENVGRLFRREILPLLDETPEDPAREKVLLWSPLSPWPHMFLEFAIATHLRLRGHSVSVAICDGALPHCERERANFPRIPCDQCLDLAESITSSFELGKKRLSDYVSRSEIEQAHAWSGRLSAADLLAYEYEGIDLGAFAARYLTAYYQGFLPLGQTIETARRVLCGELLATMYAQRVCADIRPDSVLMASGNLCQYYGAFRVLQKLGLHVVTWDEGGQWDDGFYFAHDACAGDVCLDEVWEQERLRPLSPEESGWLLDYYEELKRGRVNDRNYHPSPEADVELLRQRLRLDPGRRVFAGFSNVVWDSNVLTKNIGFESMKGWLCALIDWFSVHPDDVLVLRAHPGEKRIPLKEYRTDEGSTLPNLLAAAYPAGLPQNVRVLPAEDDAYSYSLADIADGIGVYTSNIGLEVALTGRRAWVAGKAIYQGKGFTLDIESPAHLRSELDRATWDTQLESHEVELARSFAYLWIFRHTTRLPYLQRINTLYPEVTFRDLGFLRPGNDPCLDTIVDHLLKRAPFVDVPSCTEAVWRTRGKKTWRRGAEPYV